MEFTCYQMNVKSAFLNGNLKEEVYIKKPYMFKTIEFFDHVFIKLDKALYDLKQAPGLVWKVIKIPMNMVTLEIKLTIQYFWKLEAKIFWLCMFILMIPHSEQQVNPCQRNL